MKFIALIFISLMSITTMAQNKVNVETNIKIDWEDSSFKDWAGTVMLARLKASSHGNIQGVVRFTYVPEENLVAVALKQSSGAKQITVKDAFDDFTDIEGRRIISFKPGQAVTIEMVISQDYNTMVKDQIFDVMVELSPVEYL